MTRDLVEVHQAHCLAMAALRTGHSENRVIDVAAGVVAGSIAAMTGEIRPEEAVGRIVTVDFAEPNSADGVARGG